MLLKLMDNFKKPSYYKNVNFSQTIKIKKTYWESVKEKIYNYFRKS